MRVGGADEAGVVEAATHALALARELAGPATIHYAVVTLANALAVVDPTRSRALLAEGADIGERLGYEDAGILTQEATVATRLNDWRFMLRRARHAIPLLHWQSNLPLLLGVFNLLALALSEARPDTAARFQGVARRIGQTLAVARDPAEPATAASASGYITDFRREATRLLAAALAQDRLAQDRLAQLRSEGEAMDVDHAVGYALAEIDSTLDDPAFGAR